MGTFSNKSFLRSKSVISILFLRRMHLAVSIRHVGTKFAPVGRWHRQLHFTIRVLALESGEMFLFLSYLEINIFKRKTIRACLDLRKTADVNSILDDPGAVRFVLHSINYWIGM